MTFSCSSSVNSESSEPLSRPAPAPLLEADARVSCRGGDGDGDGELRGSNETVELGIVLDVEHGEQAYERGRRLIH